MLDVVSILFWDNTILLKQYHNIRLSGNNKRPQSLPEIHNTSSLQQKL